MAMDAMTVFAVCTAYVVIGNALALLLLLRRKAPVCMMRSGMLLYLYGVCLSLRRARMLSAFALSTNIALAIGVSALIWFQTGRS